MGIFQQFPYSNFHEMNLDEIINIVKNMLNQWAEYYTEWDDWKEQVTREWQDMQDWINAYFDTLDVQQEINNKIVSMVNSGEFGAIVDPYIPPEVSAWLADHITQPTTPAIDTSLSVAGAAADAKATGDEIIDLQNDIDTLFFKEDVEITLNDNNYVSSTDGSFVYNTSSKWVQIEVTEGEIYKLTSAVAGTARAVYAFMKDTNTFISARAAVDMDTVPHSYWIVIPPNCTLLRMCTGGLGANPYVLELKKYTSIISVAKNNIYLASTYKHKNRFNINDLVTGHYYINGSNGNIVNAGLYELYVSNPIKIGFVKTYGEKLTISTSGILKNSYGYRILDANFNVITYANYNNSQSLTIDIKDGMEYIQVTYSEVENEKTTDMQVEYGASATTYEEYYGEHSNSSIVNIISKSTNVKKIVTITPTDDIMDFYNSMVAAFNEGNCDVIIKAGAYTYTNTMVETIRSAGKRGVPIGNNCRYYFETGAKIICDYTGNEYSDVGYNFSPLDSWSVGGSWELHNLDLLSKNTIYAVHDEGAASDTAYTHLYDNCKIVLDNTNCRVAGYNRAIGGGLGKHSEIICRNCYFESVYGSLVDISWHGNPNGDEANFAITNCYFEHTFGIDDDELQYTYPNYKRLIFTGNSVTSDVIELQGECAMWEVYSWGNTIRS